MWPVIKYIFKMLSYTKYNSFVFNRRSCQSYKILLCIMNLKEGNLIRNTTQSYWTPESLSSIFRSFYFMKCLLRSTSLDNNTDNKYHTIHLPTGNKLWVFIARFSWCLMGSTFSFPLQFVWNRFQVQTLLCLVCEGKRPFPSMRHAFLD